MEDSKLSSVPQVLAILWTALIIVGIVGTVTSPDPLGLNGAVVVALLTVWGLGLALGVGVRAAVRWWCCRPARKRQLG